jgi:hypothetical protein
MTTHHLGIVLAAQLLLWHATEAVSQKVYRCGPDGRVYSQTPCKDSYEAKAEDKRTPEQRKAAEDTVKREEKQAKEAAAAQGAAPIATPVAAMSAASGASASASQKKPAAKKPPPAQP